MTGKNPEAVVDISGDGTRLNRALKSADRNVSQFARGVGRSGGPAASVFTAMETGALGAAAAVGAVGAAFVKLSASAVQVSRSVGLAFAEVRTIADGAAFSTGKIQEITTRLASTYGGSIENQASALYQAISSGATSAAQAQEVLTNANRLAIAGVTDVRTAVDGLTAVLNAFKSTGLQAAEASDVLFTAVRVGRTTVPELANSIGQVSPIASTLGLSFQEVAGALAAITQDGVSTSEAVTQLRGVLAATLKPTQEAAKTAGELGIQFDTAALRSRGLRGFLEYIRGSGASEEQLGRLFGRVDALQGVLSTSGPKAERFAAALDAVEESAGSVGRGVSLVSETVDQQIKIVNALGQTFLLNFGNMITESEIFQGILDDIKLTLTFLNNVVFAAPRTQPLDLAVPFRPGFRPGAPQAAASGPTIDGGTGLPTFLLANGSAQGGQTNAPPPPPPPGSSADKKSEEAAKAAFERQLEETRRFLLTREELIREDTERRIAIVDQGIERGLILEEEGNQRKIELGQAAASELNAIRLADEQAKQDELNRIAEEAENERTRIAREAASQRLRDARRAASLQARTARESANLIIGLSELTLAIAQSSGKESIAAQKAIGTATIVANTAIGISKVIADPSIPFYLQALAIGSQVATGAAAIVKLNSASPGGGGSVGGFGGSPGALPRGRGPEAPEFDAPELRGGSEEEGRGVNFFVTGDAQVDELIDLIADRINSGDRVMVRRDSRQAEELRG